MLYLGHFLVLVLDSDDCGGFIGLEGLTCDMKRAIRGIWECALDRATNEPRN